MTWTRTEEHETRRAYEFAMQQARFGEKFRVEGEVGPGMQRIIARIFEAVRGLQLIDGPLIDQINEAGR